MEDRDAVEVNKIDASAGFEQHIIENQVKGGAGGQGDEYLPHRPVKIVRQVLNRALPRAYSQFLISPKQEGTKIGMADGYPFGPASGT